MRRRRMSVVAHNSVSLLRAVLRVLRRRLGGCCPLVPRAIKAMIKRAQLVLTLAPQSTARLNAFGELCASEGPKNTCLPSGRLPGRALQPPEAAQAPSRPHDSKQRPQRHGASRRSGGPRHGSRGDDARRRQPHDGRIGVPRAGNEAGDRALSPAEAKNSEDYSCRASTSRESS